MPYRAEQVDRRYNDWHYMLSRRCRYIDLDGVEVDSKDMPLALMEITSNPGKRAPIMVEIARRCEVPAFLVRIPSEGELTPETIIYVRQVHPREFGRSMTLAEWGQEIERLHQSRPAGFAHRSPAVPPS
jgi:hypothetical protein